MEDELFTVQEIAEKLRLTRKGVYDLMQDGRLRYIQIGPRRRRIAASALREFLKSREQGADVGKKEYNPEGRRTPMRLSSATP